MGYPWCVFESGKAMQRIIWWLIALAGAGLFGLIIYNSMRATEPPAVAQSEPRVGRPPAMPAEPEIRHPVPDMLPEKPLPALETSDSTMKNALSELSPTPGLIEALIFQGFIRRVVATIDNLPRDKVASRIMPVQRVDGAFAVTGTNESATIAAGNAAGYNPYIKIVETVDKAKFVAFYFKYYPLFQQAYRELGYPKGHFNDRLVEVIDHLLAAPELQAPVALVRPKVLYLYADPELEAKSAGQKILMRMGAENAVRIKVKLQEIRAEIAHKPAVSAMSKS